MKSANSIATAGARDAWLSTLQLAMSEVFELMLACSLEIPHPLPPKTDWRSLRWWVSLASSAGF